eukprot:TRINITY_DN9982_c0_g1_i1.p2 TRINITY_DN9982_c0_g1~~TRINITY_DN9982_c0_g1_i1.p2  ORF type:complete len:136 (-),score=32.36 TRINITY_DN9982_c0_g1_i1:34-441(-)
MGVNESWEAIKWRYAGLNDTNMNCKDMGIYRDIQTHYKGLLRYAIDVRIKMQHFFESLMGYNEAERSAYLRVQQCSMNGDVVNATLEEYVGYVFKKEEGLNDGMDCKFLRDVSLIALTHINDCLLYTSPSPRDQA